MKKESIKVVTLGGGSSYTPELVEGFIKRYDRLPVRELWLVDIEEGKEKLEIVGNLAKRMVEKAGIPMEVHLTLDRREALKDADFVTTQMRIGLLDARIKDERIPLSHGIIGQETNGAGGMFKALRTIPVILDIVKDMEELCPNAWLINFTNPAGMVTEAVLRYTNYKKVIGLCNIPVGLQNKIAEFMNVEAQRVTMQLTGLNHHVFVTNVWIDGIECMDEVLEKFMENDNKQMVKNVEARVYSKDFIRAIRAIPCAYHNYYYFTKEQLEQQLIDYEKGTVRGEVVKQVEKELFELYKNEELKEKPKQLEKRGGAHYSDAACNLICSIYNNTQDIQYVDVRNNGAVRNLPDDSAVEIGCVITADGPKPIAQGEIPVALNGTIQNIKTFERLVCQAAVTGDRKVAIAALNMNPLIPSDTIANQVFDELLEAHKRYLPQFFRGEEK